ncbi:MAG TPA: hypothetical protein VFK52_03760 [Nocardioidaceae bacterium]|nr:hypothetical protein [Nocardioidaceae bacterium]
MSVAAVGLVLGALVLALLKTKWVKPSGAIICIVFGVVLAGGPAGPAVGDALSGVGGWAYSQLRSV